MQHISNLATFLIMHVNRHASTKLFTLEYFRADIFIFLIYLWAFLHKQILWANYCKALHLSLLKICTEFSTVYLVFHKQVSRCICSFLFWYISLFQVSSDTVMQAMDVMPWNCKFIRELSKHLMEQLHQHHHMASEILKD